MIKTTLKATVAAAALFAIASPAMAGAINNGNDNSLTISGQISKAWMYADDGANELSSVVDPDTSGTRFRMNATGKVNESLTVKTSIEMEQQSNASNTVTMAADDETGQTTFVHRQAHIAFSHATMGQIRIGRQYGAASTGTWTMDSGYWAVDGAGGLTQGAGSGIAFTTNGVASAKTPGSYSFVSSGGRGQRVKYSSPSFGGAQFNADINNNGNTAYDVNYSGSAGDIDFGGMVSYQRLNAGADTFIIAAGMKHSSGFAVNGGWEDKENAAGLNSNQYHIRAAYDASLSKLGTTTFAIGYGRTEDRVAAGDEFTAISVGVSQKLDSAGTTLFINGVSNELEDTTASYDEIYTLLIGANVQF